MMATLSGRSLQLRSGVAVLLVGVVFTAAELIPLGPRPRPDVTLTIACGLLLAGSIVLVAERLALDARTQFAVWFCVMFLNLAAVAVEGTLFAPAAAPPSWLAVNLVRLAISSACIAGLVAALFASRGDIDQSIRSRPVLGWLWRLGAAAIVYSVLYLVLGGLNYSLVTHPYYESHAGGLTLPSAATVFSYEPVRGLLIALSVLPLCLALRRDARTVAIVAGGLLFVIGGVVPLLPQASLPLFVRVASLWEIFGQNFLTGVACAYLFVDGRKVGSLEREKSRSEEQEFVIRA